MSNPSNSDDEDRRYVRHGVGLWTQNGLVYQDPNAVAIEQALHKNRQESDFEKYARDALEGVAHRTYPSAKQIKLEKKRKKKDKQQTQKV
jgi:hypothetical protein